ILQSDIDLARKLINTGHPESEVVTALSYRGIDSTRAVQLITALRSGRTVEPDRPIKINLPTPEPEEVFSTEYQGTGQPTHSVARTSWSERQQAEQLRSEGRKSTGFPWFAMFALASLAVCIVAFVFLNRRSHGVGSGSPNKTAPIRGQLAATAVSLDIQPDGL